MYQSTEEKTATASETKRNVLRHWPKDVSSPVIPARFEPATHSLEGCCSNPTELRNRSDTAKLAQLFRICNTSDRVSATDRGTNIRRPVLLPYPLSNCARPHNEKAPQRPSSASSDRPSSHKESRPHYPPESSSPFGRKAVLRSEQRETQKESLLPHRSR